MRLYFRFLRRSILKRPKESIVLLITVLLSAFLFASLGEIYFALREEREGRLAAVNGYSDLRLLPTEDGETRFLTPQTAEGLGDMAAETLGIFSLPILLKERTVTAFGTSLDTVGDFFPICLTEAIPLPYAERRNAVYLTADLAREMGVALGDSLTLSVLGTERTVKVYGLHHGEFFMGGTLLCDFSMVLSVLSEASPSFFLFDEDSLPCTALYVKLAEGVTADDAKAALAISPYAETAVAETGDEYGDSYVVRLQEVTILTVILLTVAVASVLVVFSLRLLSEKRSREARAFRLSGMTERTLFLLFLPEVACYLALGAALGLILAYFLLPIWFLPLFRYAAVRLTARGVLATLLPTLLLGGLSLFLYRMLPRLRTSRRRSCVPFLILLSLSAAVMAGVLLAPLAYRYIFSAVSVFILLLTLFSGIPLLLQAMSRWVSRRAARGKNEPLLLLSVKNSGEADVRTLYSVLTAVAASGAALLLALSFCLQTVAYNTAFIDSRYTVMGAGLGAAESLRAERDVTAVAEAYFAPACLSNGQNILLLSVSDAAVLTPHAYVASDGTERLPEGDGIYLSRATAALLGAAVGDAVTVTVGSRSYAFTLCGYMADNSLYALFSAEARGLTADTLLVSVAPETEGGRAAELSSAVALLGGLLYTTEDLISPYTQELYIFSEVLRIYIALVLLLAALGCFNLVYVAYTRQREELRPLALSGVTASERRRILLCEALLLLVLSLLLTAVLASAFAVSLDCAIRSFGFSVF